MENNEAGSAFMSVKCIDSKWRFYNTNLCCSLNVLFHVRYFDVINYAQENSYIFTFFAQIPWGPIHGFNQMNVLFFQSWEQRLKLSSRWAAAVEAAHRIQKAHRGAKMKAPAVRGKSQHMFPLPSHRTSSITTGMLLLTAPAGHKEAISSWTRSVSKGLRPIAAEAAWEHSFS